MSVLAHIGRGIEKKLITAILRSGGGKPLVAALAELPGVLSVSHHHARGVGSRRVRSHQMLFDEKDVLIVLVEAERADDIFRRIYDEAGIGEPSIGMMFMEPVLRGHPMMPCEDADW
ncbi:MAG: hypothetical protein KA603_01675 [Azonexus sp.]|jgi:nitrogen regulatory protein PII|nr:hypothetical protein [Betaproteobacteria bacterium]MBK8918898.1 hypothetical protein [Betaproteobacteria bacterium]MBP6034829.1 hypothetical protein [Azonexus sp.]MBP6905369.1 hypothetical protein [Azonexus sp.]